MAVNKKIDYKSVKLGIALVDIRHKYGFDEVVEYLKGNRKETFHLCLLKPLWDEYGYKEINDLILKLEGVTPEDNKETK